MKTFKEFIEEKVEENIIPYTERPKEEKEIIDKYDKKMKSKDWKEVYDEDDHWMEGMKPCPLAMELDKDLKRMDIKKADILEIGTGNGRDSIFLAKKGNKVTGIDIAEQPIKIAKKNAKGIDNIKFQVGKAEKLEFDDESFDAVYSVAALHSSIIYDTFAEIYRVLKPGGIVKLFLYTKTKFGKRWTYYWSPEQIKSAAEGIGFKIMKFRTGHNMDKMEIPETEGEIEQNSYLAITTFKKPTNDKK